MLAISSKLFKSYLVALNVLGFAAAEIVSSTYVLDTVYEGETFFDGFDFDTISDPTHGFVNYVGESEAQSLALVSTTSLGAYMGVDYTTTLTSSGVGRNSVRITSKKSFTHGLIISDITHQPGGICGTWPAHWTLGPDWPKTGEIDIIEGVNSQTDNLMSLHTNESCTIAGDTRYQTGTTQTLDCDVYATGGVSCGISSSSASSFGAGFNEVSGGVYATQWTSDYIRIWYFPRASIPADILAGTPDPSLWGLPQANFQGSCDIDEHFQDHKIIFDTTFCGDLAGNVWKTDPTCSPQASTCVDYVAGNPAVFKEAYWLVNSVKVYQLEEPSTSAPSSVPTATSASDEHFSNTIEPEPTSLTSVGGASSLLDIGMGVSTTSSTPTSSATFPTQTISSGSNPYIIGTFFYVGCLGSSSGFSTFHQVSESTYMTPELCTSQCGEFKYAGVYSTQCFCANELDTDTGVGSGTCSIPCPGYVQQTCGGLATPSKNSTSSSTNSRLSKRQTVTLSSSVLLTTYENIVDTVAGGIGDAISSVLAQLPSPSAESPKLTITLGPGPNFSSFLAALATASPTDGVHFIPSSGIISSLPLTTVAPASSLFGLGMGGAFSQVTEVVTTYVDVCPTGLTTITTTSTITQCSCLPHLSTAAPTISLITTVKQCPVCGPDGQPSLVTVTIPLPTNSPIPVPATATATAKVPALFYSFSNFSSNSNDTVYLCPGSPNCPTITTVTASIVPVQSPAPIPSNSTAPSCPGSPNCVIIYSTATVVPVPVQNPTPAPAPAHGPAVNVNVAVIVNGTLSTFNGTIKPNGGSTTYTGAASSVQENLEQGLLVAFVVILGVGWMIL